jgi:hypothetical protein
MARYKYQGTWTDGNGRRIDSATVSVYLAGTITVASVYAAEAGGSPVNSVTTDTSGYYSFWIDDGDYTNAQLFKIIMSKANFQSKTIDDIAVIQNPNVVDTLNNQTIAGVKTSTSTRVLSSATPTDRFTETDGAADNKIWENVIVGEQYIFRVVNDALDIFGNVYTVDRTGTTVDTVNLKPTNLQHNSVKVPTISSTDTLSNKTLTSPTVTGTLDAQGGIQTDGANTLKTKVIDIGDWNMDTTSTVSVSHGLGNPGFKSIRSVTVIIRDDNDAFVYPLDYGVSASDTTRQGYIGAWTTDISLKRLTGGLFDNTTFDSTSYNRGWITITYIA